MGEVRRKIMLKLLTWLIVFAAGVAAGYYVRDQQQERIAGELERAREELERAREELVERGRRAGEDIRAGARAAADSTRAAVREMIGDTAK